MEVLHSHGYIYAFEGRGVAKTCVKIKVISLLDCTISRQTKTIDKRITYAGKTMLIYNIRVRKIFSYTMRNLLTSYMDSPWNSV